MFADDGEDSENENEFAQSIVQLIFAENVIAKPSLPFQTPSLKSSAADTATTGVQPDVKDRQARSIWDADAWLSAVSVTLSVSFMPVPEDEINVLLPHKKLHRYLFRGASRNKNKSRVPNPFAFQVSDKLFTATIGQIVDDVAL